MTTLKILDTGYYTADGTGTPAVVANRAGYDGSSTVNSFDLPITAITLNGGGNLMSQEELHNDDKMSKVSAITYKNPSFVMQVSIPISDIPTTGYQYHWLYQLMRLERTKSVKDAYIPTAITRLPFILNMYST